MHQLFGKQKRRVVDNGKTNRRQDSVYSNRVRAGKRRTYFFDVRRTKGDDFYLTLTESTKRFDGNGYERHKIFLYKEDFNRFLAGLEDAVNHVKQDLMPDYDYDEFTRRHEEYEAQLAAEAAEAANAPAAQPQVQPEPSEDVVAPVSDESDPDDDMSW